MRNSGLNQIDLKENNLEVVIRAIQSDNSCSRTSLIHSTGLKRSTITKLVNKLIDWGVVIESTSLVRSRGRKPIQLLLNAERCYVLATNVNRHKLKAGIMDLKGQIIMFEEYQITKGESAHQVMKIFKEMITRKIINSPVKINCIGVAVPGFFNPIKKRITMMSGFPGWENIDIGSELSELTNIPIYIEQNVNCCAIAELWFGKDKERYNNMLLISSDRGLGATLVRNGEIFRGSNGSFGEVGHISINPFGPKCECGNRGCLEMYASAKALEQAYLRERFKVLAESDDFFNNIVPVEDICLLVKQNDPVAISAYDQIIRYLAIGLVSIIHTLDPNLIVFNTKLSLAGDRLLEVLLSTLRLYLLPDTLNGIQFVVSEIQNEIDILGPASMCLFKLFKQPSLFFS